MVECISFEASNRINLAAMLEKLSNKVAAIDWHMTYDLNRKKFVAIARFTRNEP